MGDDLKNELFFCLYIRYESKMNERNLIEIGYCSKPHGIKGEFTFVIYEEFEDDLANGSLFYAKGKSERSNLHNKSEEFEIEKINFGHKIMVKLKNIDNRNVVEAMIPFSILLERTVIDELHEGEMLLEDYIGLEAIEFETNKKLGKVTNYYETTAQVILVIGTGEDTFEIPVVEHFVKLVDLEENKIIVLVPELF